MAYSVLMSVYCKERAEYLLQSLNSLAEQTKAPSEIVLICDGPLTPELDAAIADFDRAHPHLLRIERLKRNMGLGNALRIGVPLCQNELIARMDSDDICLKDRMQKQLNYFDAHPETDILSGAIYEFDVSPDKPVSKRAVPLTHDEIVRFSKTRSPFNHMAVMFKKSAVLKAGNYVERLRVEDHDLWIRMLKSGAHAANLSDVLVYARCGSAMHTKRHGIKNFKALNSFYWDLYKTDYISLFRYLINIGGSFALQMMPPKLHKYAYKLLRKRPEQETVQ